MAFSRGIPRGAASRPFELESAPPERLELQISPAAETVASYVLTEAAERSWQTVNQHLARPKGSVFWIGGPPGCRIPPFPNYAISPQCRARPTERLNTRRGTSGSALS